MRRTIKALSFGIIILSLTFTWGNQAVSQASAPLAQSTFDTGLDGWTGNPEELSWASTGGNPGGYARWQDIGANSLPLSAPDSFLGDWSLLDGVGFISYDQKVFSTGSYTDRGSFHVAISGPGGYAVWSGPVAPDGCPGLPGCDWTTYVVPLVESEWTLTSGTWSALLADVTALQINPELYGNISGAEIQGIDNVLLDNGLLATASSTQNIIDDTYGQGAGSFELGSYVDGGGIPPSAQGFMGVAAGDSTTIRGWTVGGPGDGVDWLNAYVYAADTGYRSVDLQHLSSSSVATVIPTVAGRVYELSFSTATVSGYSNTGVVSAGSLVNQPFEAVFSSQFATQVYTPFTFLFTATGSTTTIQFTGTGGSTAYGPVIDSVRVREANLFGGALQTAPDYEFSVEQNTPQTDSIQLSNLGGVSRSVTLEFLNPHPGLTLSLTSPNPTSVAPGETKTLSMTIDPGSLPIGKYDGILLDIAVDDGSTLYSNITVYVTASGAASLPDLTLNAGDISVVTPVPGGPVTYVATIHNQGNAPASNVPVQFNDFGALLGETVIPFIPANGSANTSVTVPAPPTSDHIIDVIIDPAGTIPELDKSNNEASKIIRLQGSSGPLTGNILVIGNLPQSVCTGSVFPVSGQAIYDLIINGVRDTGYVVKGGSVQIAIGGDGAYGDVHTDVNGNFSRFIFAPTSPGTYSVSMTVSDNTFSGTGTFAFQVADCPPDTIPPPTCPPNCPTTVGEPDGGIWKLIENLWQWICPGNDCPPVPEQDVRVYSRDILFSNDHPNPDEQITIGAQIQYFATSSGLLATQVPVTLYTTFPGSSTTELIHTVIGSMSVGTRVVYANWTPQMNGIYLIEVDIDPSYVEADMANNAATRAIIVGQYVSGQGAIAGQVYGPLDGMGGVPIDILLDGNTIDSALTDATGFYLVENVPVGDYQVQIIPPAGYTADSDVKPVTVADQSVSTVDFALSGALDTTPPVITPMVTGTLGTNGWYTSDVTVTWSVVDNESAIITESGCETSTVTMDTLGDIFTCSATSSGGTASESVTIQRDATPPTITGGNLEGANANGWYNTPVEVTFICDDATSGIASCTATQTLGQGADQSVSGTAVDNAGNSASTDVTGINIDLTPPEVTVTGVINGAVYTLGSVPAAGCVTTDTLSGVQTDATLSVIGGNANGVGLFDASCTGALDRAGNPGEATVTYQVIYPYTGFFPPVENPPAVNVARAGAAVPIKFSLAGDRGFDIFAADSPTSAAIACSGGQTSDIEQTVTAGNSSLNYDPVTDQYIYVWKTRKIWAGTCQQFILTLNDGTVHQADFEFK